MDAIEIRDDYVLVKIADQLYRIRPTFGAMMRAVKLQDRVDKAASANNADGIVAVMDETKALVLNASDIPDDVFDQLSYGQIRQLMDVIRGAMTEAGEPGKN